MCALPSRSGNCAAWEAHLRCPRHRRGKPLEAGRAAAPAFISGTRKGIRWKSRRRGSGPTPDLTLFPVGRGCGSQFRYPDRIAAERESVSMVLPAHPSLRLDGTPRPGDRRGPRHRPGRRGGAGAGRRARRAGRRAPLRSSRRPPRPIRAEGGCAGGAGAGCHRHARGSCRRRRREPRFDILVNNAGTNRPRSVPGGDRGRLRRHHALLTSAPRSSPRRRWPRAWPRLGIRGSIIHMSSQMGHVGGQRRTVYCMTKHGHRGPDQGHGRSTSRRLASG